MSDDKKEIAFWCGGVPVYEDEVDNFYGYNDNSSGSSKFVFIIITIVILLIFSILFVPNEYVYETNVAESITIEERL